MDPVAKCINDMQARSCIINNLMAQAMNHAVVGDYRTVDELMLQAEAQLVLYKDACLAYGKVLNSA